MKMINKCLLAGFICFPMATFAESAISWKKPDNYRDIESSNETQTRFQNKVFKQLENHLANLSKELPDGQKLWLTVTDVDLAGQVLPGYAHGINDSRNIRVIKSIDYPKISFSYYVTDATGTVLTSGKENLKDMNFQSNLHTKRLRKDAFNFEKQMITDWFEKTFSAEVAKK